MDFYLGVHEPTWLATLQVPAMVSRVRLARRVRPTVAAGPWVLDSGAFTELQRHGGWSISARSYAREVARWGDQLGGLVWAAPQDWMCEPVVIHGGPGFVGTGLSVAEHQARTVGNYLDLMALEAPTIPVLQGFSLADYERCVDLYEAAGVRLAGLPVVGLGSVCRREATAEVGAIVAAMAARGIRCHGFGCKAGALRRYGGLLASADSMAWSAAGRRRGPCDHLRSRCANHRHYALTWRTGILAGAQGAQLALAL